MTETIRVTTEVSEETGRQESEENSRTDVVRLIVMAVVAAISLVLGNKVLWFDIITVVAILLGGVPCVSGDP